MMNEIEFRGMDINGDWYYGNLTVLKVRNGEVLPGSYISNSVGMPFAYLVRPETVTQFIWILDKFERRIYCGDILKWEVPQVLRNMSRESKPETMLYTVVHEIGHNTIGFRFESHHPYPHNGYKFISHASDLEIVGNIFESVYDVYQKLST